MRCSAERELEHEPPVFRSFKELPENPVGGVEVGDRGAGLLDGSQGLAVGVQEPQVQGHGLRSGRKGLMAEGVGLGLEVAPGGGVGPAGAAGLGSRIPEATASAAFRSGTETSGEWWGSTAAASSVFMSGLDKVVRS